MTETTNTPVQPEVVEDGDSASAPTDAVSETITQPGKLIRIASMVRTMLDEVRRAPLDEAGRRRLREIHDRSLTELGNVLSDDLRNELAGAVHPFGAENPTDAELRIAQAQLVGWLEGLFHGIQASMVSQQIAAQAQLEQMRRQLDAGPQGQQARGGAYL